MKNKLARLPHRELGVLLLVVALYGGVCVVQPRFFSIGSVVNIFLFFPYLLLIALGEMIEVIGRNVDLSLGSILAFSGYVVGSIYQKNPEFPLLVAVIIAVAVGALLGLVNGFLVTQFEIPSVIVTLGTMYVYRGIIFMLGGRQIDNSYIPRSLIRLSQPKASIVGVPYSVLIALGVALLVGWFLRKTKGGRQIYAIGSSPEAAKLRGLNNRAITVLLFIIAGGLSGLASIIFMSRIGYLDPGTAGRGLEFIAIAAVVIGGTSMNGGVGTTLGTTIGCLLLGVINNAISIVGISGYWQEAIYGFIIVVAVLLDNALQGRIKKGGLSRDVA